MLIALSSYYWSMKRSNFKSVFNCDKKHNLKHLEATEDMVWE